VGIRYRPREVAVRQPSGGGGGGAPIAPTPGNPGARPLACFQAREQKSDPAALWLGQLSSHGQRVSPPVVCRSGDPWMVPCGADSALCVCTFAQDEHAGRALGNRRERAHLPASQEQTSEYLQWAGAAWASGAARGAFQLEDRPPRPCHPDAAPAWPARLLVLKGASAPPRNPLASAL